MSVFSSAFQGKINFRGLFMTVLYIQAVFKPVRTPGITISCLFDLILYIPSTIIQLDRDRSSWVEPVLS